MRKKEARIEFNPNFKMEYPGRDRYVFPAGEKHVSPCMSRYWTERPIYKGKRREEEIEHEEKWDEGEEE